MIGVINMINPYEMFSRPSVYCCTADELRFIRNTINKHIMEIEAMREQKELDDWRYAEEQLQSK